MKILTMIDQLTKVWKLYGDLECKIHASPSCGEYFHDIQETIIRVGVEREGDIPFAIIHGESSD